MQRLILIAALSGIAAGTASAEPGMAGEVYEPTVSQGATEFELRGGVLNGGDASGEWQVKAEASHAFTDWWRPALVGEWEYEGENAELTAFAIENVFDFTSTREWPVHFGAYVEYEAAQDGPDAVEVKLLMSRQRGPLDLRLNVIGEREVGDNASNTWEFGYAFQAGYTVGGEFELGVQGFGNLDEQAHYWGPFAQFEVGEIGDSEVELQLGYLAGFGEAEADGQFRLKLEYELGAR